MADGYISQVECAGGCGTRMPQHLVDRGWKYLYGHKGGCPKDGEPVQTKHRRALRVEPAPVQFITYPRTLEMAIVNLKAATTRRAELEDASIAAREAVLIAEEKVNAAGALVRIEFDVVRSLMNAVAPGSEVWARADEIVGKYANLFEARS